MDHSLEGVLELLAEAVGLEDVDDTHKEQEPLAFMVARWDTARATQKQIQIIINK